MFQPRMTRNFTEELGGRQGAVGPCHYHETKRSLAASGSFTFCLRLRFRRGGQRGPRAGFGAWCGPQGVVLLVRLARVCDSGLNGRFQGVCCLRVRAAMTRGTKVVLWCQNDFNSLDNAVFFVGWAGQECPGYLFVHGVKNDVRDKSRLVASKRLQFIEQRRVFRGLGRARMPGLPFCPQCQECPGYLFVPRISNAPLLLR